jgi:hypothetical protein
MTTITFAQFDDKKIKRDRWDRPMITPPGENKPVPYTRVSTLAKALDNKEGLMKWMQRQTVIGLGRRPDLVSMASAVATDTRKLDEVIDEAMKAAESNKAANIGTTLHALSEIVDKGEWPTNLTQEIAADLTAYRDAMAGLEIVGSEHFVVNDHVRAAGTFDRLLRLADGRVVIGDIKTGQREPSNPLSVTIQTAIYAHSHIYDPDRGRIGYLPDLGVSTDTGLLIHLPAGQARCDLYLLDLTVGWSLAQTAVHVREVFKGKSLAPYAPSA